MTFKVIVLGTGSAKPTLCRHHAAHVLNVHEQFYLIDCGEGTQLRLLECGINPLRLNGAFISHLHGDHVYGLFPLLSTLGLMGRKTPFTVYAPAPFGEVIEGHYRYFDTNLPFEIIYREVDTRKHALLYENTVMEVWSLPLRHRVPAAGYLFREKVPPLNVHKEAIDRYGLGIAQITAAKRGEDVELADGTVVPNGELTYRPYEPRAYAYCSDTAPFPELSGWVQGVDLLYHEATFPAGMEEMAAATFHSTTVQAAGCAAMAGVKRLIVGHYSSRVKDIRPLLDEMTPVFPKTMLAKEGDVIDIPLRRYHG